MKETLTKDILFGLEAKAPDAGIYAKIKHGWDSLSKPIDALGDFEEALCRIGAIRGSTELKLDKRSLLVFCSDNGVVCEGVSQTGAEVTLKVARMLGSKISTANTIARSVGAECIPVDVGIDTDETIPGVLNRKVRRGSRDLVRVPAMTKEETLEAINAGIELVRKLVDEGTDIILTGEMGIGNTTTATALLCLLGAGTADTLTGRGAGLSDKGLEKKKAVIEKAVEIYGGDTFAGDKEKAFTQLCRAGGYDIAAMCGAFIGGALSSVPVVIDGLISAAAALAAEMIVPGCRDHMLASHSGREHGVSRVLEMLKLRAFINGDMALGEGTGALMLLPLLDTVLAYYKGGSTFAQGGIKEYERLS